MNTMITESVELGRVTVREDAQGPLLDVEFITAGWGSSGYYSPEVVEAAAPLFTVGTQMYFDHPTASEERERPARSVRDMCATVVEAGVYNPETQGIRGTVRPFKAYEALLTDDAFLSAVGLSIRASADREVGEVAGRAGFIIQELEYVASCDVVTRAGRGGRVLALVESANPAVTDRAIARGIAEATADERRQQLSDAVRAAYADETHYAWVMDFDESTVWFQASAENEESHYWAQGYTAADDDLTVILDGSRSEVRPVTRYLPVNAPDPEDVQEHSDDPVTRPGGTQEDTMPQIEEAELTRLNEAAGRVPQLEESLRTAETRAETAESTLVTERRTNRASTMLNESEHSFSVLEARGLMVDLPVVEADGTLDEAAFTQRIAEAAATRAEAGGAGRIRSMGGDTQPLGESATPEQLREESDKARASAFGREKKAV